MATLNGYILRELLRNFLLALIALTGLFTMGGGLYNVIRYEAVTAADVLRALHILIPVVLTFTMPIAALFAATITYGRLAADNELTACKAAGINIHRLLGPVLLLSVLVAGTSVYLVNYVFPDMTRKLDRMVRTNLRDLVYQQLRQRGYVRHGNDGAGQKLLTAQRVQNLDPKALIEHGFDPPGEGVSYLWVDQAAVLIADERGELKQFFFAEGALVQFDTRSENVLGTVYLKNGRNFELGRSIVDVRNQKLGPIPIPMQIPFKASMADLDNLLAWRLRPWEATSLRGEFSEYLAKLRQFAFLERLREQLRRGEALQLRDGDGRTVLVRAAALETGDKRPLLIDVDVSIQDRESRPLLHYTAPRAAIAASAGSNQDSSELVALHLMETAEQMVTEQKSPAGPRQVRKIKEQFLDGLLIPADVLATAEFSPAEISDAAVPIASNEPLEDMRARLIKSVDQFQRRVVSILHFRLGLSGSALVTIVMGAILGIIFRGSRILTAFALAMTPLFCVFILAYMGRQLGEQATTAAIGPYIIWGALALVGVLDVVLLRLAVRR
jgi:lipopolysaccharide export LptBFGC system permease protein LptF